MVNPVTGIGKFLGGTFGKIFSILLASGRWRFTFGILVIFTLFGTSLMAAFESGDWKNDFFIPVGTEIGGADDKIGMATDAILEEKSGTSSTTYSQFLFWTSISDNLIDLLKAVWTYVAFFAFLWIIGAFVFNNSSAFASRLIFALITIAIVQIMYLALTDSTGTPFQGVWHLLTNLNVFTGGTPT